MEPVRKQHVIDAPPRLVYDIVTDYENYPSVFPEFKEAIVLDTDGTATIVEFTVDFGKSVSYTLRIDHDEEALKTEWTYVGGDLKNSVGGWHFQDNGEGGTKIDYHVGVEVGFFVPRAISDRLVSRNIPEMFKQLDKAVAARRG